MTVWIVPETNHWYEKNVQIQNVHDFEHFFPLLCLPGVIQLSKGVISPCVSLTMDKIL